MDTDTDVKRMSFSLVTLRLLCCNLIILFSVSIPNSKSGIHAFTLESISLHSSRHKDCHHHYQSHFPPPVISLLLSSKPADNDDDDVDDGDNKNEQSIDLTNIPNQPKSKKLGINLSSYLNPLTPSDAAELKAEASDTINAAFDARREELLNLKSSIAADFEQSKLDINYESDKRAEAEAKKLMSGMDALCEEFLEETKVVREGTKMAARADLGMEGKGLEVGSWGSVGDMDVLTVGGGGGIGGGVLGSVGAAGASARSRAERMLEEDEDGKLVIEEVENKILVVFEGKKNPGMQNVLNRFETLLSQNFPNQKISLTTYLPTSILPMGGAGAQTAILISSSLSNGRTSAETILNRLLKRALPQAGAPITPPPSHLLVVSSLGTSRTDKFPYSMQNIMGGKLTKMEEVEEVVVSTVKGRMVAEGGSGNVPLDYTVIKLGDVVEDSKAMNKGKGSDDDGSVITIRPGDSLDGTVGVEAAANVLLQAVTMQPNARNSTMSVTGGMMTTADSADNDVFVWEDSFLRLDGPELWRMEEEGVWNKGDGIDRAFTALTTYLGEWSLIFDNGAKGTGLTTPVRVGPTKLRLAQEEEESSSIRAKWSVRLEFKATSTGSAYKSKSEEREFERQRSSPSSNDSSSRSNKKKPGVIKNVMQKREGGVEMLVEKTRSMDDTMGIRVRARRCNMDDFTVIKEISEETIVKKIQEAVRVWKTQYVQ